MSADLDSTLRVTAQTIRQVASWATDDDGKRDDLYTMAEAVERADAESLSWVCPVCEEVECDEGCPLASARAAIDNEKRLGAAVADAWRAGDEDRLRQLCQGYEVERDPIEPGKVTIKVRSFGQRGFVEFTVTKET